MYVLVGCDSSSSDSGGEGDGCSTVIVVTILQ